MEKEVWKDIKNYEGRYQVSNLGRVKNSKKSKVLKQQLSDYGYLTVTLRKEGKRESLFSHKEMLKAFKANPQGRTQGNHLNGDKTDNRLGNLDWCTPSENIKHAFRTGLVRRLQGELNTHAKLVANEVMAIRVMHKTGRFDNPTLSEMFKVSTSNISAIILGKSWKHLPI